MHGVVLLVVMVIQMVFFIFGSYTSVYTYRLTFFTSCSNRGIDDQILLSLMTLGCKFTANLLPASLKPMPIYRPCHHEICWTLGKVVTTGVNDTVNLPSVSTMPACDTPP
jgi:hypothetical protein